MQAETDQSKISCEAEELKPPVDTPGDVAESDPEIADPFVLPPDSQPSANADNLDKTDDTGIFTADHRRQLTREHCSSSSSWG